MLLEVSLLLTTSLRATSSTNRKASELIHFFIGAQASQRPKTRFLVVCE